MSSFLQIEDRSKSFYPRPKHRIPVLYPIQSRWIKFLPPNLLELCDLLLYSRGRVFSAENRTYWLTGPKGL